jgi:cytochrome b
MPETIQRAAATPRLMHHPLAATFLAILWATLLVAFVAGVSGHFGDTAFAQGDASGAHAVEDGRSSADAP